MCVNITLLQFSPVWSHSEVTHHSTCRWYTTRYVAVSCVIRWFSSFKLREGLLSGFVFVLNLTQLLLLGVNGGSVLFFLTQYLPQMSSVFYCFVMIT